MGRPLRGASFFRTPDRGSAAAGPTVSSGPTDVPQLAGMSPGLRVDEM